MNRASETSPVITEKVKRAGDREHDWEIDWELLACELEKIPHLSSNTERLERGRPAITKVILADAERRGADEILLRISHRKRSADDTIPSGGVSNEKPWRVYFRMGGTSQPVMEIPLDLFGPVTGTLKSLAQIDGPIRRGAIHVRMKSGDREWTVGYLVEHALQNAQESLTLTRLYPGD